MKKLVIYLLSGFVAILLLLVIGCEGNAGKRGITGDPGDNGNPYADPIPANRYFSLAIGNNSMIVHNGAPKLFLSFDSLQASSGDTVVCQPLASGRTPEIDGLDGGTAEWGPKFTDVALRRAAGYDNQIHSALVRAAYDQNYVYFQVKWTEVADSAFGLTASESNSPKRWLHGFDFRDSVIVDSTASIDTTKVPPVTNWVYIWEHIFIGGNPKAWQTTDVNQDQDRVLFLFEITNIFRYDHDGCLVTCHAADDPNLPETNFHSTGNAKYRMDVWSWSSVSSNPTGHADDKYMDSRGVAATPAEDLGYFDGIKADLGIPPTLLNLEISADTAIHRPLYRSSDKSDMHPAYPLWEWQIASVDTIGWDSTATIPRFITRIPTGSRADVTAQGKFDNGTWTVEFKRARNTGNGDDVRF